MSLTEYSIKNRVISWLFLVILAIGGIQSFNDLGRLEDPAFTIKDAMVISTYSGATSTEVEEELTYPLEKDPQASLYRQHQIHVLCRSFSDHGEYGDGLWPGRASANLG
ncbi:acriflavin resistance protein [Vibrio variabilis]|uniref:Acriflavin resistance protein n=1 Tax=Vibrio variabilis TaxID=990271 RepID=A0ABQ0JLE2_9VIBR|nr:acriflavin resistance protein [Vibrio variabilis]